MTTATAAGPISIKQENLDTFIDEAMPLFELHYAEIAHYQDIPLDVDIDRYRAIEAAGGLRVYTARTPEGWLIGYAVFFVAPHPHYRGSIQASNDVVYIEPEFRLGRVGLALLHHCEKFLRDEGVQVFLHHVKNKHPKLGRIIEHMGYEPMDTIYVKRLDR
jgi:GNAT superfamily N-acetyltransferase